jgi:4-deoxy-L-threo-5-hexosulose-uronate ketol-isomerase
MRGENAVSAIDIEIREAVHFEQAERMSTAELRRHFLVEDLFRPGRGKLVYTHYDRMVLLGLMPTDAPLAFGPELGELVRTPFFLARRELSVVNIGGPGRIVADGLGYELLKDDVLYLPRGTERVAFDSEAAADPAKFYGTSAPAHATYAPRLLKAAQIAGAELGSAGAANRRLRANYVDPDNLDACQVMMGSTRLQHGSVWNSMPPHVHDRRMEAYLYYDLPAGEALVHLMGRPHETRHIMVHDGQAVISPPWSIHCGCGTSNYAFIWAMAGDNQVFNDMDAAPVASLL